MKEAGIAGLIERFADLPDPRVEGRTDHDLLDIVVLARCAVMSGAEGWDDIEDWGREREAWLRRYLRLRNGIPGHDTIRRVFEALSPLALEERHLSGGDRAGDCHRRQSLARLGPIRTRLAGVASGVGLRRGVRTDDGPTHLRREIERDHRDRRIAALAGARRRHRYGRRHGLSTVITEQITTGGGDYVLAVKDNHPQLAEALRDFFSTLNAPGHCRRQVSLYETLDKGHGRIETRRCTAIGELDWLELLGLKAR
jgi:hypothetical protein